LRRGSATQRFPARSSSASGCSAEVEEIVEAEPLGGLELKGFAKPVAAFAVASAVPVGT
jgi:hypothetical protein